MSEHNQTTNSIDHNTLYYRIREAAEHIELLRLWEDVTTAKLLPAVKKQLQQLIREKL